MDQENLSYLNAHTWLKYSLFSLLSLILILLIVVAIQVTHKPLPIFYAQTTDGRRVQMAPLESPNLLSNTIINWASKATVAAYTFDFVNADKQLAAVRSYFTPAGWSSYMQTMTDAIANIKNKQLFVNLAISGQPIIANQGEISPGKYGWRVQLPVIVTNQSADTTVPEHYLVTLVIIRVPTVKNVNGMGVDQFVMQ